MLISLNHNDANEQFREALTQMLAALMVLARRHPERADAAVAEAEDALDKVGGAVSPSNPIKRPSGWLLLAHGGIEP